MPLEVTARVCRYGPEGKQLSEVEAPFEECLPVVEAALMWLEEAEA